MYELSKAIMDDRLRSADRARLARRARARARTDARALRRRERALGQLRRIVGAAETLGVADERAWRGIGASAAETTAELSADGLLPRHLVVAADERPAVLARTLVAGLRRLERSSDG